MMKTLAYLEVVKMDYGVAYNFPIGLLISFGAKSLQFKKVYNSKSLNQDSQD